MIYDSRICIYEYLRAMNWFYIGEGLPPPFPSLLRG